MKGGTDLPKATWNFSIQAFHNLTGKQNNGYDD